MSHLSLCWVPLSSWLMAFLLTLKLSHMLTGFLHVSNPDGQINLMLYEAIFAKWEVESFSFSPIHTLLLTVFLRYWHKALFLGDIKARLNHYSTWATSLIIHPSLLYYPCFSFYPWLVLLNKTIAPNSCLRFYFLVNLG